MSINATYFRRWTWYMADSLREDKKQLGRASGVFQLVGGFRQPERESRLSNSSTDGRLHVVVAVESKPTEIPHSLVCSSCADGLRKINSKFC